ncbi:MAG: response regulator [Pseudanabaena sp. CAN_BIN31]|nr:response regulator [Pseudanabaena sp. CAN_BIN31]
MEIQNFQVLIVDDNEINRDMLARRLHRKDFSLSMATNGREALLMVQSNRYDLILLDIMMPEIDGYAVLTHLKKDSRLRDIPVIMISAIEEMDSVMKCMEIGADDYLTKPFDPETLNAAINRCLPDKGQFPTPSTISIPSSSNFNFDDSSTQVSEFKLAEDPTRVASANTVSLDEVVHRIMQRGMISRKGYLYFSKAIFNALFENSGLTDQEVYQIRSVFDAIQSGQIRVVDPNSSK